MVSVVSRPLNTATQPASKTTAVVALTKHSRHLLTDLSHSAHPANPNSATKNKKKKIDDYAALGKDGLAGKIKAFEDKIEDAESSFRDEVSKLQAKYEELMADKDKTIADIKASGIGMAK